MKEQFPAFYQDIQRNFRIHIFFSPTLRRWLKGRNSGRTQKHQPKAKKKILTILTKQIYSFPKIKHCPLSIIVDPCSSKYTIPSLQKSVEYGADVYSVFVANFARFS